MPANPKAMSAPRLLGQGTAARQLPRRRRPRRPPPARRVPTTTARPATCPSWNASPAPSPPGRSRSCAGTAPDSPTRQPRAPTSQRQEHQAARLRLPELRQLPAPTPAALRHPMPFDAPVELDLDAVVAEVAEALADTRLIFLTSRFMASVGPFVSRYRRVSLPARLPSHLRRARGLSGEHGRGVRGRRGHPREARLVSVTDAPLTSPEFAEALRAFGKDVVAAQ